MPRGVAWGTLRTLQLPIGKLQWAEARRLGSGPQLATRLLNSAPGASVSRLTTSPELVSQRALHKEQLCPSCTLVIPSLCQTVWLGGGGGSFQSQAASGPFPGFSTARVTLGQSLDHSESRPPRP